MGRTRRSVDLFKFTVFVVATLVAGGWLAVSIGSAHAANKKYAAVVVDVKSGRTLYASSANSLRYPASLTKIMTLYVLFEEMQAGRIKNDTRMRVSRRAAGQAPSKLGLKPGSTIRADDAIRALVTKSANDIAVVIAEHISGSESAFARRMTRTAHSIGMSRTTFRNASGLPNAGQRTTARDMARLGTAIQDHFPVYYRHFATRSFQYRGRRYSNHNRLLGRVKGVDGIKTGYIRASGFNLVASVKRDRRQIVAVVMGGRTGKSRDAHMRVLVDKYMRRAKRGKRTAPIVAAGGGGPVHAPVPPRRPDTEFVTSSISPKTVYPEGSVETLDRSAVKRKSAPAAVEASAASNRLSKLSGWTIQIGAMPSHWAAVELMKSARAKSGSTLSKSEPYTQTYVNNNNTFYRVRFAGFQSKKSATSACRALKRKKFACFTIYQ
jgi:D-alanyl-D-alanine carboxypeptidase